MNKNNHITKNHKNCSNIKSINSSQKQNNALISSDNYKSPKNSTILSTISSIQYLKKTQEIKIKKYLR